MRGPGACWRTLPTAAGSPLIQGISPKAGTSTRRGSEISSETFELASRLTAAIATTATAAGTIAAR